MCGISGIVSENVARHRKAQDAMVQSMYHRGPDENAVHFFENCSLGHNRLSIVDITTGKQPMLTEDAQVGIVFNGEIYGYKEIRRHVHYEYKTESDTELILALYSQHGTGLVNYLPGMFSFAIWDDNKHQLFVSRDRFGEKPFYYAITTDGDFVFASEIKAILASGLTKQSINPTAVSRFLNHGYIGPDLTIYNNIKALPPAHSLVFKDGKVEVKRYWNYPETTHHSLSLTDAADKFEHLFKEAVRKQMVADVEVSAFLSGGLDSTSIVKIASEYDKSIKTLAYGYKGVSSELPYARLAAELYGTNHKEVEEQHIMLDELFRILPNVYDEPFSDTSAVATYLICKEARKHGKVVLTGDAGDELLGGYVWWYKPIIEQTALKNTNTALRLFVHAMAAGEKIAESSIYKTVGRTWRDKYYTIKTKEKYPTPLKSIQSRFDWLSAEETRMLDLPTQPIFNPSWKEDGTINDAMKFDIADYMAGDILVKTDRASMANSVELRSPFLDVDLASFCISLPGELKVDAARDKILLREAFSKYWPEEIKARPKQGFGLASDTWSNTPGMQALYKQYVHSRNSTLYNVLPYDGVQNLIKKKKNIVHQLFVLGIWASKNNIN